MTIGILLIAFAALCWVACWVAETIYLRQPSVVPTNHDWPWEEAHARYEATVRVRILSLLLAPLSTWFGAFCIALAGAEPEWWRFALVVVATVVVQGAEIFKLNTFYIDKDRVHRHFYRLCPYKCG